MDRLLSEQEILNACAIRAKDALWKTMTADEKFKASSTAIAKAQRDLTAAAVNAEWVEWTEKYEATLNHSLDTHCILIRWELWKNRRKEIGI